MNSTRRSRSTRRAASRLARHAIRLWLRRIVASYHQTKNDPQALTTPGGRWNQTPQV
jgi:hypothetical protein